MRSIQIIAFILFVLFCVNAFASQDEYVEKLKDLGLVAIPMALLIGSIFYFTDTKRRK